MQDPPGRSRMAVALEETWRHEGNTEGITMERNEHPWKVVFTGQPTEHAEPSPPAPSVPAGEHSAAPSQNILSFQEAADCEPAGEATDSTGGVNAADAVEAIIKTAHVLRGVLSDHFAEFGLTDVRYTVMRLIDEADASGRSQADLANYLQQSESSISTLIDRMRSDSLLYRLPSATDRRKKVLKLSERGRELLQAIQSCHSQRMEELLQKLDWENASQFRRQICSLADQLTALNRSGNILGTLKPASSIAPAAQTEPAWRRSA